MNHTYLLLLHEDPAATADLAPEALAALIQRYADWAAEQGAAGRLVGGEKLAASGGRHLRKSGDRVAVVDGPFAEAKELVGGFFLIQAASLAEAEALAATCPHLDWGWIELRQVEPTGP